MNCFAVIIITWMIHSSCNDKLLMKFCMVSSVTFTFGEDVEGHFDAGKGSRSDLTTDLVEANPTAHDQLLDGLLILTHFGGEFFQRAEAWWRGILLLILPT